MLAMKHAGLTMIELLIVLVIAGVLLGAAAPSFHQSLQRLRLQAAVNDLLAAIDLTRTQALARGSKVLMAPLKEEWQSGWVVFLDQNGNRRPDAEEKILYRHDPLRTDIVITSKFTSGNSPAYLAYNGTGRTCAAGNSIAARWGTLSLTQGDQARHIKINMLGRVRVCDPATASATCTGADD
ncbi:prepilin-type N-terminal cleavage/methylation domain-containing protein [Duganella sp. CY42W]|uniref:Type II secretion system protein H n=2 Tax=Duganella levis TaxID=2692169 RepID=A0ABW9WA91_9BURK|nr:prepilin-type N-terminal cleavage/methylation domain-containing protein [Duganella levis]